jgi:hypothetical protein
VNRPNAALQVLQMDIVSTHLSMTGYRLERRTKLSIEPSQVLQLTKSFESS